MNHKRGFGLLLVLAVAAILLIGGAFLYVKTHYAPTETSSIEVATSTAQTSGQLNQESTAPSATIDQSSLTTSSPTPTISGTFSLINGNGRPWIVISTKPLPSDVYESFPNDPSPSPDPLSSQNGIVWKYIPGGVYNDSYSTTDGKYSIIVDAPLSPGSYYVGIYYITDSVRYQYEMGLVATSTLTVEK